MNRNNRRRRRRGRKPDRPTEGPAAETPPTEPPKQAELVPDMGAGGELQPSEQISHSLSQKLVAESFTLLNNLIQVPIETHGDEFGWSMAASGIAAMLNQVMKDFNVNSTSLETALMEGLHGAARARKQELN